MKGSLPSLGWFAYAAAWLVGISLAFAIPSYILVLSAPQGIAQVPLWAFPAFLAAVAVAWILVLWCRPRPVLEWEGPLVERWSVEWFAHGLIWLLAVWLALAILPAWRVREGAEFAWALRTEESWLSSFVAQFLWLFGWIAEAPFWVALLFLLDVGLAWGLVLWQHVHLGWAFALLGLVLLSVIVPLLPPSTALATVLLCVACSIAIGKAILAVAGRGDAARSSRLSAGGRVVPPKGLVESDGHD